MLKTPDPVNDGSSYRVLALPTESFNDADRTLVTNPADRPGSPFGWHDTNGVAGPEFTTTQGNNAHAYMDQDDNNTPDFNSSPDGGASLTFDFPIDPTEHAQNYRGAATTNLFYANNMIHDLLHRYGFDEASGNFQANNYGRGGTGGDYVRAEAADGNGTNNAMFGTPPNDGGTPRMQMYLWPGNQFGSQNSVTVDGVTYGASYARFTPAATKAGLAGQRSSTPAPAARRPLPDHAPDRELDRRRRRRHGRGPVPVPDARAGRRDARRQGARGRPQRGGRRAGADRRDDRRAGQRSRRSRSRRPTAPRSRPRSPPARRPAASPSTRAIRASATATSRTGSSPTSTAHGLSSRLTGGVGNRLPERQRAGGRGLERLPRDHAAPGPGARRPGAPRGMGPYALFQADRHGNGIRPRPYSRDMNIQPFTYDSIKSNGWLNGTSLALPHGLGHGWASVLWDMNWDLIDKYGFNRDLYAAWNTGGNNRAFQYVIDGLKMQGCDPGLVVARAAIIAGAETRNNGAADTCTVWATFARRGLGYSAVQGTTNRNDNTEAFDTHPNCLRGFQGVAAGPAITDGRARDHRCR